MGDLVHDTRGQQGRKETESEKEHAPQGPDAGTMLFYALHFRRRCLASVNPNQKVEKFVIFLRKLNALIYTLLHLTIGGTSNDNLFFNLFDARNTESVFAFSGVRAFVHRVVRVNMSVASVSRHFKEGGSHDFIGVSAFL